MRCAFTPASAVILSAIFALSACEQGSGGEGLPGGDDTQPFSAVAEGERIRFTGTEPFWGGDVQGGTLLYRTPEDQDGRAIEVTRFAGRGGLSYSGMLEGQSFDMTVTPGECSDGMSDRTYPFTVTLNIGNELRQGCGWTRARPYEDNRASQAQD